MSYGPRARDRYRLVVATLTGVTTVGAITSTGLIAAVAATDHSESLAEQAGLARAAAQEHAAAEAAYVAALAAYAAANAVDPQQLGPTGPVIAPKRRPADERVATRYAAEAGSTTVGAGGSVSSGTREQRSVSGQKSNDGKDAGSTGGSGGSDSGGEASAPPPPPPPPPPSSGS